MKKFFAVLILCLNFAACGGNDSSSADEENLEISFSSSSVVCSSSQMPINESSSAKSRVGCETDVLYGVGWPISLRETSSLKEFSAYGNNLACDYDMQKNIATLYRSVGDNKQWEDWEKIGSVDVVTTLFSEGISREYKYAADFSVFDEPSPLPDGFYKVTWGKNEDFSVMFYIQRNLPDTEISILRETYGEKMYVVLNVPDELASTNFMQRGFLLDTIHGESYPLTCKTEMSYATYYCRLEQYQNSLEEGAYKVRWEAFSPFVAPNEVVFKDIINSKVKDSVVAWSYVFDSTGNLKDGIYGTVKELEFYFDRTAPKAVDVMKSEYSVKTDGSVKSRDFTLNLKLYENLLGRKSQRVKVEFRVRRVLAYREILNIESDTTVTEIKFNYTTKNNWETYLDIYFEDEIGNEDSLHIENLDVLDSQFVENSLEWVPAQIPYKDYDCEQYKCVSTAFLNPDVEYGEFLDERDNQVYKTVQIGDQTWFAQNLNFETDSSSCVKDAQDSCDKYGRLYMWNDAVGISLDDCPLDSDCVLTNSDSSGKNVQGVCPEGWHIPSFDDSYTLKTSITELYDKKNDMWGSRVLKSQHGWNEGFSSNETGFSMISYNGENKGYLWLSDGYLTSHVDERFGYRYYNNNRVVFLGFDSNKDDFPGFEIGDKTEGRSVRCIKD